MRKRWQVDTLLTREKWEVQSSSQQRDDEAVQEKQEKRAFESKDTTLDHLKSWSLSMTFELTFSLNKIFKNSFKYNFTHSLRGLGDDQEAVTTKHQQQKASDELAYVQQLPFNIRSRTEWTSKVDTPSSVLFNSFPTEQETKKTSDLKRAFIK